MTAPIVTIFGGSGFVGRYIARRMAKRGWRVRVAVRRPNEALFVRPYGDVGQVEPIQANLRDEGSTARAVEGATAVVNSVGILFEGGAQRFDAVQAEGAARAARLAAAAGAERFVQISAIGADPASPSAYGRSKAAGEAAVLAAFPAATILRPSIVFGREDQFFNRFAAMARLSPAIPLVGAETKFQPVYVDDVAAAAAMAAAGEAEPGLYELGGPGVHSFRDLIDMMLKETRRRRLVLPVPGFAGRIIASVLGAVETASFGLVPNRQITLDQIALLGADNVVSPGARGFGAFGLAPVSVESVIGEYLWAYRPAGQFEAITESAGRLKG